MLDPLPYDRAQREGRISEAAGRAESIVDLPRVTDNLAERCLAFVEQCDSAVPESTVPSAFLDYLGTSSTVFQDVAPHDFRGALNACLGRYDHALRDVSALLLARAASTALVEGLKAAHLPTDMLVSRLFQLCGVDSLAYDALNASLQVTLRQDEPAQKAMLGHLGRCVDDINQDPSKFVFEQHRESFDHYVLEWRERPSIVDLWRGSAGRQFLPSFDRLDFVDAVLGAAPAETLRVLDRLRFPQPLDWILTADSIRHDADRISDLTRCAPRSVDSDGTWNGSILALLLLKEADNYCRDYWRAAHRDDEAIERARDLLHAWLMQLADVVIKRNDGTFLATQWLLMKLQDERFERSSRGEGGHLPQLEMIGWIGGGLTEAGLRGGDMAGTPHADVEHNAEDVSRRRSNEAARLDLLALIAMLDRLDEDVVSDNQILLSQLDVLLADRDHSFEVEATFDIGIIGFVDSTVGYLLATEDCAERWKLSWDRLIDQRRVVQHWRHTKDGDALAPSLFLMRAGLAALDWLCSESFGRREVAETLWRTMFDAVRECWLTISLAHLAKSIERDIGRLFCRHPTVFGASITKPHSNLPYGELLADDLWTLGGDDVLVARCCELVWRNLQDRSHLHHALRCKSNNGQAMLKRFLRWQQLERRAKRQPEHLRQVVEQILGELDDSAVRGAT